MRNRNLPEIKDYSESESVQLFGNTGIQFLDLGIELDLKKAGEGHFAMLSHGMLVRLFENPQDSRYYYEKNADNSDEIILSEPVRSTLEVSLNASLEALNGVWLPVPFFRFRSPHRFDEGPCNWARMRVDHLKGVDQNNKTHRFTFAFDTKILKKHEGVSYLTPNEEDLNAGAVFRLASSLNQMKWFLDQLWVKEWLVEVFEAHCSKVKEPQSPNEVAREPMSSDAVAKAIASQEHIAHYLNLLSLFSGPAPVTHPELKAKVPLPRVMVKFSHNSEKRGVISVDLILDVGNSRTCGILLEDHERVGSGLRDRDVLTLRDLSRPYMVYRHPFDSRVEFVKLDFGKPHLSAKSGRHEAFQWLSMVRVGDEALRLASQRTGSEGSTGLSSPKRYLWDTERYAEPGWRLNAGDGKEGNGVALSATLQPLANLIDEQGEPLYKAPDSLPVFTPCYSRSSLMTFMLNEVLSQALIQINSILYRSNRQNADTARELRNVILTVPPGMPLVERSIFNERVKEALGLLWVSLGWASADADPFENREAATVPVPKVEVRWDEATCGQLVYLYTEVVENFGGRPEEFFQVLSRQEHASKDTLTVASIDIGGGTTDLVINDYCLERDAAASVNSSNVKIVPEQRFRDGFKVAGDDIVLDIIRLFVLPALGDALGRCIGKDPKSTDVTYLLHKICGAESEGGASGAVLRQQLTLQVFQPIALALLRVYEAYDITQPAHMQTQTFAEWIGGAAAISKSVRKYVGKLINGNDHFSVKFDLSSVSLGFNPADLHARFFRDELAICKTIQSLAEVVDQYQCDILLITGRPARLPGIQMLVRKQFPLPPGRILNMQNYRTGSWYPFHRAGLVDDPKTTASVGAMLACLSEKKRLTNFFFSTGSLKPSAVMRYFGMIGANNTIKKDDVLFNNIPVTKYGGMDLEALEIRENGKLPPFLMRGSARLAYRQLAAERWPATPIYTLSFSSEWIKKYTDVQETTLNPSEPEVRVTFGLKSKSGKDARTVVGRMTDELVITEVETVDGSPIRKSDVRLELNTMSSTSFAQNLYWLDSGNVAL